MKTLRIRPAVLCTLPFALCASAVAQTTAITGITVIDMTGAPPQSGRTVVIQGNRITSVGTGTAPAGARVIDGRGKFLIPGLWDMHVHLTIPGGETRWTQRSGGVCSRRRNWQRSSQAGHRPPLQLATLRP